MVFGGWCTIKFFDKLPPSSDALQQKRLRTAYHYLAGHVWGNLLAKNPDPSSLTDWNWQKDGPDSDPVPVWTTATPISRTSLKELAVCGCRHANGITTSSKAKVHIPLQVQGPLHAHYSTFRCMNTQFLQFYKLFSLLSSRYRILQHLFFLFET